VSRTLREPFAALKPLLSALVRAPLPPVLLVTGDDDWILAEAVKRCAAAFRGAFAEGEISTYAAPGAKVKEAVDDAATVALFATNRLVVLEATELLRGGTVTAEELDALLDEAQDARGRDDAERALSRLGKRAAALAAAAGATEGDASETARKLAGRVKRAARADEVAELLARAGENEEAVETALARLLDYAARASAGDNALLLHALSPDRDHAALAALRRSATAADLLAPDEEARRARLVELGLERAIERKVVVDPEVFELLLERGRVSARSFLSELDRLIDSAEGPRVTAEAAAGLVLDERKEYGSDFVDAVVSRRPLEALRIFERLMVGDSFTAFRPYGGKDDAAPRKGPRGEAAFFPLLGLLAGEIRRVLSVKCALAERGGGGGRRVDYRSFVDRVLPGLRSPKEGAAPIPLDGHPYVLHKAYLAALDWSLPDLVDALRGLEAIDRGVKGGGGSGPELLEAYLLARTPALTRQ
jgi:DNA polymerase III delta subunit